MGCICVNSSGRLVISLTIIRCSHGTSNFQYPRRSAVDDGLPMYFVCHSVADHQAGRATDQYSAGVISASACGYSTRSSNQLWPGVSPHCARMVAEPVLCIWIGLLVRGATVAVVYALAGV